MFNDERIIIQSGKIFRFANLIALVIALLNLLSMVISISFMKMAFNILLVSTEIAIIIVSSIILLYGELGFKNRIMDERVLQEKYLFYNKSITLLLISILLGYSFRLLGPLDIGGLNIPANQIIILLEGVGVFYIYYQFKKYDININYSFIENTKKDYYKIVFKKLLKFGIIIISMYLIAGIIGSLYYQDLGRFLVLFAAGIDSVIGLGGLYFLLSFLEKKDYDNEKTKVKISFVIAMLIYVGITLICACGETYVHSIIQKAMESIDAVSVDFTKIISKASEDLQRIAQFSSLGTMFINISLCYLMSYFKEVKKLRTLISILFVLFISQIICDEIEVILTMVSRYDMSLSRITALMTVYVNLIISLVFQVVYLLIIIVFVKDLKLPKVLIIIPIISIINVFVWVALNTMKASIFDNDMTLIILNVSVNSIISIIRWFVPMILIYKKYKLIEE